MANQLLKVTLVKSMSNLRPDHKACVRGLGLRRLRHTIQIQDTPCVRGMIRKVNYLLCVEPI